MKSKIDFAIETTLSGKNYLHKVKEWQKQGYEVILIFLWLNSPSLAIERINDRVRQGGHYVSEEIVIRRYYRGIKNLFSYFIPLSDYWLIIDNSKETPIGIKDIELEIFSKDIWLKIKEIYNEK